MNNYENLIYKMLDNRYRITGIEGVGGMAVVYKADDVVMNRKVAIKILKDEYNEDTQEVKRFINESKAIAMLSHQNIVQIFDVSVKNGLNLHYIVMELIDGINLKDYIVRKGKLKWQEAISYTEQILNALKHAHSKGIIHRDIKPQNVMLLRDGNLKITDFGIAKMQGSEPLTMTDKAIGTVHYISPEQANGTANITNVSDIYSTGVLLYEMTTGELPFNGDTAIQIAMKQINETPRNPRSINPEIPRGLAQIILKAMNKNPDDRYQSAGDMINQLNILSANPAVVFSATSSSGGSNLPVVVDANMQKNTEVVKTDKKTAVEIANKNNKIEKIDEDEMRRKGRSTKKVFKRKQNRSMFPIISGVTLAFLIVLGVSAVNIFFAIFNTIVPEDTAKDTIQIQNYVGKILDDDLKSQIESLRLYVRNVSYEVNDDFEEGAIISQLPVANDTKKFPNATSTLPIDFTVSIGKAKYPLEDLSIMEFRETKIALERKRIEVIEKQVAHDTVPIGFIISTEPSPGIDPETGEPVILTAGDTLIVYVSTGQDAKNVQMPNVVGKTEKEARKELDSLQIYIKKIECVYSDTVPAGCIAEQDINPYRVVPRKSTRVTLKKSMGPKPNEP